MAASAALAGSPLNNILGRIAEHREILFAAGIVFVIMALIIPIPAFFLDFLLAVSIAFSVMVLLTALFIEEPLEFSSFPTVLLIATMLRLSLNLASTRLILADGHAGPDAAGKVIEAFGGFVMQGNYVIGIIVFCILVIVNFVVITKGSGRIAEVAARFSLDAMPGKQMAIDADLAAGLIDESKARSRRQKLEEESAFFGAMDGSAKFVRGDAIAGLLITAINLIGGLIVGVGQMGISFGDAATSYTLLTVGDGLVSQIPALVVSTAAGLLVSKAGVNQRVDKALFSQLGSRSQTFGLTSGLLFGFAFLPGLPMLPFFALGSAAGLACWKLARKPAADPEGGVPAVAEGGGGEPAVAGEEPASAAMQLDPLKLELGYGLLQLIQGGGAVTALPEQVKALRRQLAQDLGFLLPAVRIQDNLDLPSNSYSIRLKEMEIGRGEVHPSMLLVMSPTGDPIELPGEPTTEPTFGLDASWVARSLRDQALARGLTVVEPATVVTTHLTEMVKDNLPDLLSFALTRQMLRDLDEPYQQLVADLVPQKISFGTIQRVLQSLLAERVSIRDLPLILEAISDLAHGGVSVTLLVEHVRARLARQISKDATVAAGYIPVLTLSPRWEASFADALVGQGEDRQLAMPPTDLQRFMADVRARFEEQAMRGELPALVTTPAIRPFVRSLVERFHPATMVLSQNEIHPKARVKTLGQV